MANKSGFITYQEYVPNKGAKVLEIKMDQIAVFRHSDSSSGNQVLCEVHLGCGLVFIIHGSARDNQKDLESMWETMWESIG